VLVLLALPINVFFIMVLAMAIYYRRHRRTDLAAAYVALNIGVFTVSALMLAQQVELAMAFGLFGVLSILRLRSDQISQREVGYYFIALALGLTNGIASSVPVAMIGLNVLLVATMYVADHPRLSRGVERRMITLDTVHGDDGSLRADLARRLNAEILRADVVSADYVRDITEVDVRFRTRRSLAVPGHASAPADVEGSRPLDQTHPLDTVR
jgi:hypothetical protein